MDEIVKFQSENKYLLMAYNQKEQKLIGRIVANHDKKPLEILLEDYRNHLGNAFTRVPRIGNYINVLMHIFGYFCQDLSSNEKNFVLDTFNKYKNGKIPLSVPMNLLRSYVIKYELPYLLQQSIWMPYPEDLMELGDTGKIDDI